jgi:predicted transcriptional regulator
MSRQSIGAASWVHVLQGLVARELVEEMGISGRRAAELLGVAPSAISQYLSGRRLRTLFPAFAARGEARRIARRVAQRLLDLPVATSAPPRMLLEAAAELAERTRESTRERPRAEPEEDLVVERELVRALRRRVLGEQNAVASCMQLAQKARDELTRAIFRQIAADSLRHAEIVTSLASQLDRGMAVAYASGITRRDVERMMEREHAAEAGGQEFSRTLGGTMGLLAASMEADERKHEVLLKGLLASGFHDAEIPR